MASASISAERTVIYGLIDPRSNQLFYVGKTDKTPKERLKAHLGEARAGRRRRVLSKIRQVVGAGGIPDIFEIETVDRSEWIEAEQFWIAYFKFCGARLANHTAGGDGLSGWHHRPESIEKSASAHRGLKRSDDTRSRMREAWSLERRAAHRERLIGVPMSGEQKHKLREAMYGRKRPQHLIDAVATKLRGRKHTEEQKRKAAEGVRRAWTEERKIEQAERFRRIRKATPLKPECINGHAMSGDNLYVRKNGHRECKTCIRMRRIKSGSATN